MPSPNLRGSTPRVSTVGARTVSETKPQSTLRVREVYGSQRVTVRFRVDGTRKERSFLTVEHAKAWQRVLEQVRPERALKMLDAEEVTEATRTHTVTLDEMMRLYNDSRTGVEPATIEDYEMFVRTSIAPFMGATPVKPVTTDQQGSLRPLGGSSVSRFRARARPTAASGTPPPILLDKRDAFVQGFAASASAQ